MAYQGTVRRIKQHPLGRRKLKTVTPGHLQAFIDFMSCGGVNPDRTASPPMSRGYMLQFPADCKTRSASLCSRNGSSPSTLCSM